MGGWLLVGSLLSLYGTITSNLIGIQDFPLSPKLPDHWKRCKRTDPDINECLKVAINDAMGDLMNGVPELGILPLDPLHLTSLRMDLKGPASVDLIMANLDFNGIRSARITSLQANLSGGRQRSKLKLLEPLVMTGDYTINGNVYGQPVVGRGKCNLTLVNVELDIDTNFEMRANEGQTYAHLANMDLEISQSSVYTRLDNLVSGNENLSSKKDLFLDQNWRQVFESLKNTIEKGLGAALTEIANTVFESVPLDQIVPFS